jgi:Cu+-exporting ATPase
VRGTQVNPTAAPARCGTGGITVHFCSPGCATAFDAEPRRYATIAGMVVPSGGGQ